MIGTIKWYNSDKGYGFIVPEGGGPDVFVHASRVKHLSTEPEPGDAVEFETEPGKSGKGLQAKDVRYKNASQ